MPILFSSGGRRGPDVALKPTPTACASLRALAAALGAAFDCGSQHEGLMAVGVPDWDARLRHEMVYVLSDGRHVPIWI